MVLNISLGALAGLSCLLLLWQWLAARAFPLHRRNPGLSSWPGMTLLKPLKGCDEETERCLSTWMEQDYPGPVQIIFVVGDTADPVCELVRRLIARFPSREAQLVISRPLTGTNAKVAKLAQVESLARHEVIVVSDADVLVDHGLLRELAIALADPDVGLVNCFYEMADPQTPALKLEAVSVNVDFWSQVLQSQVLKPMDFALGAVMAARRAALAQIGGFAALKDCLADDYQLGNRIARNGHRIALAPTVVACRSGSMGWIGVWHHQVRWARTIRVCQPLPYFFSVLHNPTFWPGLWAVLAPGALSLSAFAAMLVLRAASAWDLQRRLTRRPPGVFGLWRIWVKDLLQVILWASAFAGNRVRWRGQHLRLRRDGTLERARA